MPDHYLLQSLHTLSKEQTAAIMKQLEFRLKILESDDSNLHIPISVLPIPVGIKAGMRDRKMHIVKDLLLAGEEQLFAICGVGVKNLASLKKLIFTIEQRKEALKGLTGKPYKKPCYRKPTEPIIFETSNYIHRQQEQPASHKTK